MRLTWLGENQPEAVTKAKTRRKKKVIPGVIQTEESEP